MSWRKKKQEIWIKKNPTYGKVYLHNINKALKSIFFLFGIGDELTKISISVYRRSPNKVLGICWLVEFSLWQSQIEFLLVFVLPSKVSIQIQPVVIVVTRLGGWEVNTNFIQWLSKIDIQLQLLYRFRSHFLST